MIIGITGGTGCGKTTLLDAIRQAGGMILDCDAIYHQLLKNDAQLLQTIENRFPGVVENGQLPSWIVIIIMSREFIISGFRLIATEHGIVIAVNYWGKFKTTFQMIMIILMIMNLPALSLVTDIVMWIALILTIISLATYIMQNMDVVRTMELK